MPIFFKDKSNKPKADTSQKTGIEPPSIRVEETITLVHQPPKLSREPSPLRNAVEKVKLLIPRPSHSHVRGPSERAKSQEYLPVLDITANPNIDDKDRPVETKNYLSKSLKPADRPFAGSASETAKASLGDKSANLPTQQNDPVAKVETDWNAVQDAIQVSRHQVQAMHTIGGGVSRLHLGEVRGPAEGLAAMPGHPHYAYDNSGTLEADDRGISRHQSLDTGDSSEQEVAHVSSRSAQLEGAHHFTVAGSSRFDNRVTHKYYYGDHAGTYDIPHLKEYVSFKAIHDSSAQDPLRRVHPGTRQYVLKRIQDWIGTPSAKERIFWLHGPAGIGKSAIAQTIAHSCAAYAREKLAATFFFYRFEPGRNDGNRLFTTLAWQFAFSIPATKHKLIHSLNKRPDIPMKNVETQFEELIVKPLLASKRSGVQLSAPVVIIDGVDECSDDDLQQRFLKIIGNAVKESRVPLRFLICSRPEAHIQDVINIFRSVTLPLDLAGLDDANQDIEKYLKAEFFRIATEQDLDPAWPGEKIIQEFVYKASGQFVYAATVIKYVGDKYSTAETQLDIIRGSKPPSTTSPFAALDELYMEILRRQHNQVFLKDFLSLLIGRNGIDLDGLHKDDAMLMNISTKDLHRKLRGMHSLLKLEPYINVHHPSFLEFLQDPSRSGQYYISKQAGTRRYLDLIVCSLVQYALTVIDGHDDHQTHFSPQFQYLVDEYPAEIALPVEELQEALQPLLDLWNTLLTLRNFRCTWELLPCKECTGFHTMRKLLLLLTFRLGASDPIPNSALITEPHANGEKHSSGTPSIPIEIETNALGQNLNACLSSLLTRLRRRMLGISLDKDTIQLTRSLLRFNHVETAMKLQSISDAQNLVDLIDELIDNKYFFSDYGPDISCKAVHLALEIYARVPVLPRSLFSKGAVGSHYYSWNSFRETELLFQTAFMCKILDPNYILRVSRIYEEDDRFCFVIDNVKESKVSLGRWRKWSKPSSVTRIRVMLEVAKAIRYFHSMGIVLHYAVDSNSIFLDSEFHARFRFLGSTVHYKSRYERHFSQANVLFFGCLLYEMYFDTYISPYDRIHNNDFLAKRPSKPEIRDDVWQLIQRCCAEDSKSRPTMDDIVREMEAWHIT